MQERVAELKVVAQEDERKRRAEIDAAKRVCNIQTHKPGMLLCILAGYSIGNKKDEAAAHVLLVVYFEVVVRIQTALSAIGMEELGCSKGCQWLLLHDCDISKRLSTMSCCFS